MKVRINIATAPLNSNRRFALGATAVGLVAVIGLVVLSWSAYRSWSSDRSVLARQEQLEMRIGQLQQQRQSLAEYFNQPETVMRRERAATLNGLIQQRAFPWIKIFTDLETILPEGVRVVSVEPKLDGDNVQLKVIVGAATDEEKQRFLERLEKAPEFSDVQLLTETRATRPEQTDHVTLELQALYSAI